MTATTFAKLCEGPKTAQSTGFGVSESVRVNMVVTVAPHGPAVSDMDGTSS